MILRKKGFTLIEMLVVIMIIAILAAALFPAITAAIATAKGTAMKNKGRGIWTSVLSANAEREPLGMKSVWPNEYNLYGTSTEYFKFLMGWTGNAGALTYVAGASPICEDLKAPTLVGPGMQAALDAASFAAANNAWCFAACINSNNIISEDAFIFTRNIDFGSGIGNGLEVRTQDISRVEIADTATATLGGYNLNRGISVSYGGACVDRRVKYMGLNSLGNAANTLFTTNALIHRP